MANATYARRPAEEIEAVLTAAVPFIAFDITGRFVFCLEAGEDFLVSINDCAPFPMLANGWLRLAEGEEFRKLAIRRKAAPAVANNTVRLIVSDGTYGVQSTSVVGAVTLAGIPSVKDIPSAGFTPGLADLVLVANTNTELFPANASANLRRVTNLGTVAARFGTAAELTAGRGEILQPGECREIRVTAQLHIRSAGTPTINRSEEVY